MSRKRLYGTGVNKKIDTKHSKSSHHEEIVKFSIATDIHDNDIRRLWSYNSTSGGKYVYMTQGGSIYKVEATGESEALTDITFVLPPNRNHFQPMFELRFKKEDTWYSVHASESGVTASKITAGATLFGVIQFWSPNSPYVALRSNQHQDGHNLYLSSSGAGHMKLKRWNEPIPESPFTTPEVDPALLFRVVRPLGQKDTASL